MFWQKVEDFFGEMDPPGDDGGKEYLRSLAEQKLRSFSIGNMGAKRTLTKKEQEEMKKKQDQVQITDLDT